MLSSLGGHPIASHWRSAGGMPLIRGFDHDDACRPLEAQFEEAQETDDFEAAANSIREAVEVTQPYLAQLRELPIPENGADAAEELLTKREAGVTLSDRFADALEAEDQARIKSLAREINSLDDESDGIATGYGFKVCGQQD